MSRSHRCVDPAESVEANVSHRPSGEMAGHVVTPTPCAFAGSCSVRRIRPSSADPRRDGWSHAKAAIPSDAATATQGRKRRAARDGDACRAGRLRHRSRGRAGVRARPLELQLHVVRGLDPFLGILGEQRAHEPIQGRRRERREPGERFGRARHDRRDQRRRALALERGASRSPSRRGRSRGTTGRSERPPPGHRAAREPCTGTSRRSCRPR